MNILKNILRPFVEFGQEEAGGSGKETKGQTPGKGGSAKQADQPADDNLPVNIGSAYPAADLPAPGTAVKLGEYQKHFEDLIEEANAKNPMFRGTDFKEFIDSKVDVEAITDEETKYRTAFNVLKRTGLTKERLISTGEAYINLIEQDLKGFADAFAQQYKTNVEQKERLLKSKSDELQALNEKINVLNKELKQMSQEILQSRDKLNNNKASFTLAGENKKAEIKEELKKIDQYFS